MYPNMMSQSIEGGVSWEVGMSPHFLTQVLGRGVSRIRQTTGKGREAEDRLRAVISTLTSAPFS